MDDGGDEGGDVCGEQDGHGGDRGKVAAARDLRRRRRQRWAMAEAGRAELRTDGQRDGGRSDNGLFRAEMTPCRGEAADLNIERHGSKLGGKVPAVKVPAVKVRGRHR